MTMTAMAGATAKIGESHQLRDHRHDVLAAGAAEHAMTSSLPNPPLMAGASDGAP
jgi:hypothetical protein